VTAAPESTPLERYALDSVKYNTLTSTQRANFLAKIENNNKLGIAFAHSDSATLGEADTFLSAVADRDIDVVKPSEAVARFEDSSPAQPFGRPVPENDLRAWYPMLNEQSTVVDASGFNNDAAWNTTAEYTTGPFGRAAKFAVGSSDNLQVTNDSSIIPGTGDVSIVATVRTFDLQLGDRNYFWYFGPTGGVLDCYWTNGQISAGIDDGSNSTQVSEQYVPSRSGDILQIAVVRDTTAGEFGLYLNVA